MFDALVRDNSGKKVPMVIIRNLDTTVKRLSNKVDIAAVSFHFLMHGNTYLFIYLQITAGQYTGH